MRGFSPAGKLGLCLPLRLGPRTTFWNVSPRSDGVPATMPGGVEAVFDSGQVHLMLLLDLDLLHRTLPPDLASRLVDAGKDRFVPMARTAVISLTSWLCEVLDETARHPEALGYPAAVRAFEDELLDRLARTVQLEEPSSHGQISHCAGRVSTGHSSSCVHQTTPRRYRCRTCARQPA